MARQYSRYTIISAAGDPLAGDDVLEDLKSIAPTNSTIIDRSGNVIWTAPTEEDE